ncbi:uncharacterized protein LOC116555167 [Sapajus apella]|uniref:Uncharacterized protein LOC116555167 n=1 Tax=Sapajus apella TaxID=9515 RepID=A0A6J3IBF4_SAPAP|nr:uncharacterized protein LOC116555167 [Sapajus apella]
MGAALNSLPQLPGCPRLPKAQISGAGGGGRRRSQEARPLHSLSSPSSARQRAAPWGRPRSGDGGGSEGASLWETPSSSTKHAFLAARYGTTLPPSPFQGLRQCGSLVSLESPLSLHCVNVVAIKF